MSALRDRAIGTDELVLFWRQFHGNVEEGVAVGNVKKMLHALCEQKNVQYSEEETDKVLEKVTRGQAPVASLNFEQFRVFFATALSHKAIDLSESLAVDALEISQLTHK